MKKQGRTHEREMLIWINFNFDFLVLYKMYFQNSFVNRSIKWKLMRKCLFLFNCKDTACYNGTFIIVLEHLKHAMIIAGILVCITYGLQLLLKSLNTPADHDLLRLVYYVNLFP